MVILRHLFPQRRAALESAGKLAAFDEPAVFEKTDGRWP
jgi:hypothetical protein